MKSTKKYILFIFCLLYIAYSHAQTNLVMNPSFEQFKHCPNDWNEADSAKYWDWINPACNNTAHYNGRGELYTSSCPLVPTYSIYYNVPYNIETTYQKARTGNSYIGLTSIYSVPPSVNNDIRDYLKGQLSSILQAGKNYCLTFYYNASNRIEYATNQFGAYVDDGSIANYSCLGSIPVSPQAQNNPTVFMTDTMNWVKIQGMFTAIGNENTITLGNFVDSATIQFKLVNAPSGNAAPYYLIDDISLVPVDLAVYAGTDTTLTKGDSTYIGRPFEIGLNDDCIWYVNNIAIDTAAGLWVKPITTTSYVLEQNICGTISYDTVKVIVKPTGIERFSNTTKLSIYPNPAKDMITVSSTMEITTLTIKDVLGNMIKQQRTGVKIANVDINGLSEGIYFIEVVIEGNSFIQKFIVQH